MDDSSPLACSGGSHFWLQARNAGSCSLSGTAPNVSGTEWYLLKQVIPKIPSVGFTAAA
jgi:hypothetical protein